MQTQLATSAGSAPGERGSLVAILSALLAVALLAACSKSPETSNASDASAPAQAGAADAPQQVDEPVASDEPTIRRASRALTGKRLFEPAHDNALTLYLKVLEESTEAEASNEDGRLRRLTDSVGADPKMLAQQTLLDLFPFGLIWVEGAIKEERFADAERVIGLLDRVQPKAASVQNLRDTLQTARSNLEKPRESERLAQLQAETRSPASDQAQTGATPTTTPGVATTATTPVAAPPSAGVATATPTTAMRSQAAPAAQPATRGDRPATPAEAAASEVDLVLERSVTPRYPSRAKRQRIEGWVEVRFTVLADGSVTDPVVTQSEPSGVFDRDAVEAVRRWKYEPPASPTAATRRIEFRLNG